MLQLLERELSLRWEAAMAITEEHVVRLIVDDRATQGYDKATASAKQYDKATENVAKSTERSRAELAKKAAGLLALTAALTQSVRIFAEQDAAQGRLDRAMRKANATAKEQAAIQSQLRNATERYGVSVVESRDAMDALLRVTGDATAAQQDFNLALDIAGQENVSLAQASEMLRKVRNGEVEEIKRLSGINKELAQELGRIKDGTERASQTMAILSKEYAGAREETLGLSNQMAATQENIERVMGSVGALVNELGKLAGVIGNGEDNLLAKFATGMEGFARAAGEAREEIERIAEGLSDATLLDFLGGRSLMDIGLDRASQRDSLEAIGYGKETQDRLIDFYKKLDTIKSESARKLLTEEFFAEEAERIRNAGRKGPIGVTVADVVEPVDEHNKPERKARRERATEAARERAERAAARREEEEQAKARAMMEEIQAQEDWRRDNEAWEAELEREAERERVAQEREDRIQRELELRDRIAQLEIDGQSYEAQRLAIEESTLTATEKRLRLLDLERQKQDAIADAAQRKMEADLAAVSALGGAIGVALELAGEEEAARKAVAAVDALVYQYKAIAAFGDPLTFGQGIAYQAAAVKAGAVATGAIGGSGGGGGVSSAAAPALPSESSSRDTARLFAEEFANTTRQREGSITNIFEYRSTKRPDPDEARVFLDAVESEQRRRSGGRL